MPQQWTRETDRKPFWNQNSTAAEAEDQEVERSQGMMGMQQTDAYLLKKLNLGNISKCQM